MNTSAAPPRPERASTDGSLQKERDKTDTELLERASAAEVVAKEVIQEARRTADDLLEDARQRADNVDPTQKGPPPSSVQHDRRLEDRVVHHARLEADSVLKTELWERKRALDDLLRLEREGTDEDLLVERIQADEALGTRDIILAMVSHDLRNLLGSMALHTEFMLRDLPADVDPKSGTRARTERIQRSVARMNRLVGDLLDVARIEEGKLAVQPTRLDLTPLLREAVELAEPAAQAAKLTLRVEAPPDPVLVPADRDRILQVMANLLANAFKFTPAGGTVTVRVASTSNGALVSVQDTGKGVPAAELESVFVKFRQVETAGGSSVGLGLGLYISKCILEGHQGRIWAENPPGGGGLFRFTLPDA